MNEEFEELELIGRGSFGQIRKVKRESDGRILVRKEISYSTMNHKEKDQLVAEFRILKSLVHPNIVQYLHREHIASEHEVHLYMEYCGGGDLAGLIRKCRESNEYVPENIVWSIFTQLILALYRCHFNVDPPATGELFCLENEAPPPHPSTVILHRDIKPDNVFLDAENNIKLGDFGLAKMLDQEHVMANTYVGTPFYMSPEVLTDQPYTPHSDIWSLGCVIYELCTLHPPFQAKSHLALSQKIREGSYPALPDVYSRTLNKTIAACINVNPLQRPTTDELLKLDVIKLCRRQRELNEWHHHLSVSEETLIQREQVLLEREAALEHELEIYKQQKEQEIFNEMEQRLSQLIEKEVERRIEVYQQQHQPQHQTPVQPPLSPLDMTMASSTPATSRNIRGPRSIHDNIISPLRAAQSQLREAEDMDNVPQSPLLPYSRSSSSSSTNSADSQSTATTSTSIGSYTSNWQTKSSSPPPPQRAAPHYSIVHSTPGAGMGAAAAKARILGIKGTPGALGRATTARLQHDKGKSNSWDENVYGDDMPSPFLRRWERRVEMNNRAG